MSRQNKIEIVNQTKNKINDVYYEKINLVFDYTISFLNIKDSIQLSTIFVDPKKQVELNKKYRNKDYVADVLSFAMEENDMINLSNITGIRELGDIFICYDKALEQSKKYEHSLIREICFLFLHGFLHILGYDHINKADEIVMFKIQKEVLNYLGITRVNNFE